MPAQDKQLTCILINFVIYIANCNAANIFCIFPTASFSHQQPALALSRALAAKGHNLTVITANPSEVQISNHREISINFMYEALHSKETEKEMGVTIQKRFTPIEIIDFLPGMFRVAWSRIHKSSQIQDLIREVNGTKYDLIIFEPLFASSLLGFADLIGNPPMIGVTSFHLSSSVDLSLGNPVIPSYMPQFFNTISTDMSFWERLNNLFLELYYNYVIQMQVVPIQEKLMHDSFGNFERKINDLEYNKSLVIASADLATGYAKPLQPNTVYVGPMHLQKNLKPLPQDVQKWMDESEDGVIYFSLGSNMKGTSVPEAFRGSFIKAFKQFPKVRVLWKWESDEKLPGQPDNVLVKKWLPQQPILAHPKMRLFISQVGLQSFQEATYYGVPILGVPIFGDQDSNAKKLESAGAGLSIEFRSINDDIIYEKLKELLTNKSYKEKMDRLSAITRDKPMNPVDTAIWWVEYVLRHNGAPHLRPASLDFGWYQYYMIDILSLVIFFAFTVLYTAYVILNKLIKSFSSLSRDTNKVKVN